MDKIYFFGEKNGRSVKIGFTSGSLKQRKKNLEGGQLQKIDLVLLAAVHGTATNERELHSYFAHLKDDANSTETYEPDLQLLHYVNWLRQQWWVYLLEDDHVDVIPSWLEWRPLPDRVVPFADENPFAVGEMFERQVSYSGPLAGTFWNKLSTPTPQLGEDFYTPTEIVEAAREAMQDIDLDAASHWRANKEHKIKLYFHHARSAMDNKWQGRVWLNPPYGNNAPWFEQIIRYWDSGDITQLCMISPVWAFTTQIARRVIDRSSAMLLLSPTPKFWGSPSGGSGSNHPHAIIYLGTRTREFHQAFSKFGIPVSFPALKEPVT